MYRQRFESWEAAKDATDIDPSLEKYSDEELLDFLRAKAEKVEHRPFRRKDIAQDPDMPHQRIYNRRFDSFQAAKEQAGVTYESNFQDDA